MNYVGSYNNEINVSEKRISKDLYHLKKIYITSRFSLIKKETKSILYFYLDNRQYIFEITNKYPFTVPSMKINNKLYYDYYFYKYEKIKHKCSFLKLSCPCCNNISCNWSPMYRLKSLVSDCEKYKKKYNELLSFYIFYNKNIFDDLVYQMISFYLLK